MGSTTRTIDRPCTVAKGLAEDKPATPKASPPPAAPIDYVREADKLTRLVEGSKFGLSGKVNTELHRRVKRFGEIGLRTHDKATRDSILHLLTAAASYNVDLSYEGSIRATAREYLARMRGVKPVVPDTHVASTTMFLAPAD